MAHLIDKDALVAMIERQQRNLCVLSQSNEVELRKNAAIQNGVYCNLISFINTLEVKEVDLESEMDKYFETMEVLEHENIFEDTFQMIAKHFFELGLKARQG